MNFKLSNFLNPKHILASLCVGFICLGSIVALFAYVIALDSTANENTMHITIQTKAPGYSTYLLQETSANTTQSFWNKWMHGNQNFIKETPIQPDFKIHDNTISYKPLLQTDFLSISKISLIAIILFADILRT